jgi:sigma-B regulation protein RsbU (phosphoserine phosphatase)
MLAPREELDGGMSVPDCEDLVRELAENRRRLEELGVLVEAGSLLDASLEFRELVQMALALALRVLAGDAALLLTRQRREERAFYLVRGGDELHVLPRNPSRLAKDVVRLGKTMVRRGDGTPGAVAAAEVLGEAPVVRVAVPLKRGTRILGALEVAYRAEPTPRLLAGDSALESLADHVAIALDNAELVRAHAQRLDELARLYEIGAKINANLDLQVILPTIVNLYSELVPSDAAGIFLIDESTREIHEQTLRGYGPDQMEGVQLKVGKGILGWVAHTGEGVIVPDVRRDARYIPARSATRCEMAAPLRYEERVIGVFNLESDEVDAYTPHDLDLLMSFGNHAAISIMNARLHGELWAKRRLEEQLRVARDIQETLLPRKAPRIEGHELVGKNFASSEVGGDYFDFLPLGGQRWAVIIADVSGSGIPAGLIMAGFRAEVRAILRQTDDPCRVLAEVNEVLCRELDPDRFVTALLSVYDPASGRLVYSNAGHEAGLLVRAGGGVERLTEGGLLLGAFPEAAYGRAMVHLAPGDRLLLYTDGLSDAMDPWGGLLGEEGIVRLLREADAEGVKGESLPEWILMRAREAALQPPDEVDDRTLVILSRGRDE